MVAARSPWIAAGSVLAAIASLIYAAFAWKAYRTTRLASLPETNTVRVTSSPAAPVTKNEALQVNSAAVPTAVNPTATPRPPNFGTRARVSGRFDVLASFTRDESLVGSYLASLHTQLDLRYRQFFVSRRLSPAEQTRFLEILQRYGTQRIELDVAGYSTGLSTDSAVKLQLEAAARERDGALIELLGKEGREAMTEFDRSLPQRTLVTRVTSILAESHSPLTQKQAAALVPIFARMNQIEVSPEGLRQSASLDQMEKAITEASAELTELQLDAFKSVLAPQISWKLRTKKPTPKTAP